MRICNLLALAAAAQRVISQEIDTKALSGRFLHITDFHPDWFYTEGAKLNDFCHAEPRSSTPSSLPNDVPPRSLAKKDHKEARAGYWAPPPNTECDASIQLVNATFDYIKRELVDRQGGLDFVIWTGDNARHDNDNRFPRTLKQIYASNEFMVVKMQEVFGKDKYSAKFVPVIPTIGNNDVYPHNIMFAGPNSKTIAAYKNMWRAYIPPEQSHTFDRGAYFHMLVAPQLAVISMNSLYFYENNKAVDGCSSKAEPGTLQLDWLDIQLRLFRQQGTKVWIIGHVPPTGRQWYTTCYNRYANLIIQYRDLVIGQLFGHVNIDHFYFIQYSQERASVASPILEDAQPQVPIPLSRGVRIQKNPLDVLVEARATFDNLPTLPSNSVRASSGPFDLDSAIGNLAVVNVAPSVVPNYFPTLRVYHYLTASTDQLADTFASAELKENRRSINKRRRKKKKKKKKKKKLPAVDSLGPGYVQQRYTPMSYTQYFLNTTQANGNNSDLQFHYQVEYDTFAWPYFMPDLTVPSWVGLGREISGLNGHGRLPAKVQHANWFTRLLHSTHDSREHFIALMNAVTGNKKGRRKKSKRHNGMWSVFTFRGFVSTGMEVEYATAN